MATIDTTNIDMQRALVLAERAIEAFKDTHQLRLARSVGSVALQNRNKALKKHGAAVARMISPMIEHRTIPDGLRLEALIVLADLETYL